MIRFTTRRALAAVSLMAFALASLSVRADDDLDRDEMAVKTRQSVFYLMGYYITPLVAMARGQLPVNGDAVATGSSRIASLAPMIPETFRRDTREADVETEALDLIWDNPEDFAAKAENLAAKANELNAIAAGGDEGAIKAAIGAMGNACGSCHDEYREEDD